MHRATAVGFRAWGPHNRFDHQRPGPNGRPTVNRGRGVLYGAPTLLCCVGEFFAETGEITVPGVRLARLTVKERLWLLDLRGTAANGAGARGKVVARGNHHWPLDHPDLADELQVVSHRLRLPIAR